MAIESLTALVGEFISRFHYPAPFIVLLLCGIGLPLPEEVTLIGCGILLYQGKVEFVPISIVCASAILLGDSIPYWLGRFYGMRALEIPWVRRVLHPERFAKLETRFREHGDKTTFVSRFLPGVRIPAYFLAGTMRMSYLRFILLDSIGVALSVPASIWLGKFFGGQIDELQKAYRNLHLLLALLIVALMLVLGIRAFSRRSVAAPPRPGEHEPGTPD